MSMAETFVILNHGLADEKTTEANALYQMLVDENRSVESLALARRVIPFSSDLEFLKNSIIEELDRMFIYLKMFSECDDPECNALAFIGNYILRNILVEGK